MRAASLIGSPGAPRETQRGGDQLLRALAAGLAQQLVRLGGRVAKLEQPFAGEPARLLRLAAAGEDLLLGRLLGVGGDLLAQLDDDALGGALADPRNHLE